MPLIIRPGDPEHDAAPISAIYDHYIQHTTVTFEETPVFAEAIAARMVGVRKAGLPWLVAVRANAVVGYAYATPWKARFGYRFSVESTVYVDRTCTGQGVGTRLYSALFGELEGTELHSVLGGIALPNDASVALHEKMGMTQVAHFKEVGTKFGRWIDVGYWQRVLST